MVQAARADADAEGAVIDDGYADADGPAPVRTVADLVDADTASRGTAASSRAGGASSLGQGRGASARGASVRGGRSDS